MPPELDPIASEAERMETLATVCAEVLEIMFFSEAVPAECEHCRRALAARVRFAGSHTGEMLLAISEDAAASLASAFLGLEPEEAGERERGQVIAELANILCGAVLSRLWPEASLLLEAPELAGAESILEGAAHHCFALAEGTLAISLRLAGTETR